MNILLLSQFFSTTKGGGEYLFKIMAKNLAQRNHKIHIITLEIENEDYNVDENIKVHLISPKLKYEGGLPPGLLDNIRYTINAVKLGKKLIKKEKIDIIHSNNFAPALAGSILSFLTSKPHITAIWDIFTLCGKDFWKKWVQQRGVTKIQTFLGPRFEKLILKIPSKAIHTISEATNDDLKKFGAKKPIFVISPAIEKIECGNTQVNFSQFVYVGRLVFYKNVEVLIRAVKLIKKTVPNIKLIIIGGGPQRKLLEDLTKELNVESSVDFRGYVNSEEKTKLVTQSNALVFPSLCEGFGLVILEAFSHKKPVLVANLRPMSDIVTDSVTGYILDPHNEEVWSEHMLKLIKEPEKATLMGKNANELWLTKYSQNSMCEAVLKMYKKIVKST